MHPVMQFISPLQLEQRKTSPLSVYNSNIAVLLFKSNILNLCKTATKRQKRLLVKTIHGKTRNVFYLAAGLLNNTHTWNSDTVHLQ